MCPPLNGFFTRGGRRRRLLWVLGAMTIVFGAATSWFALEMEDHGVGIFELEFTGTSERAAEHHAELGPEGREDARASLVLDYPFLLGYGLFLAGACPIVANRALRRRWSRLAAAGALFAWAGLLGAACDAVENAMLLLIVGGHTDQPWPGIGLGFTIAKFALAGTATLYLALGWFATLVRRAPAYQP